MSKCIIVCHGSLGDLVPCLSIAIELKALKHDVEVLSYPVFKGIVEEKGVKFVSVSKEECYQKMVACGPGLSNDEYAFHHWFTNAQYGVEDSYKYIKQQYSIDKNLKVFGLHHCYGARWACEDLNLSFIRLSVSPNELINQKESNEVSKTKIKHTKSIERVGSALRNRYFSASNIDSYADTNFNIALFPEILIPKKNRFEVAKNTVFTGFLKKHWADVSSHPHYQMVYTSGTAFTPHQNELNVFSDLCEDIGCNGLFLTGQGHDYSPVSKRVSIKSRVDFRSVLHKDCIFIHHGGIGTIADALLTKTPQIIVPRFFDQHFNAELIQDLGVGLAVNLESLMNPVKLKIATNKIHSCRDKYLKNIELLNLYEADNSTVSDELLRALKHCENHTECRDPYEYMAMLEPAEKYG